MSIKIKIGHCYMAKLSKKTVPVRVDSVHPEGGWTVRSLETGRLTVVKEKDKFLRACEDRDMDTERPPNRRSLQPTSVEPTPIETVPPEPPTEVKQKLSALDAAHKVLLEANGELSTPEIVQIAIDKGYWKTGGKTPAGTLHAAISRDIAKNRNDSRFVKGERGKFYANLPY